MIVIFYLCDDHYQVGVYFLNFRAAIATVLQDVYNSDSAVAGEAASIATGLVMLGSADEEVCC